MSACESRLERTISPIALLMPSVFRRSPCVPGFAPTSRLRKAPAPRNSRMYQLIWSLFFIFGLGGVAQAQRPATAVIVATALEQVLEDRLEVLGDVQAQESVQISASVADTVTRILFAEGQQVVRGQALIELNHAEEAAELRAAEARRLEKRSALERLRELYQQGLATAAELDLAQAGLDAAVADSDALRAAIEDRIIRAPFDGVLGLRHVSPGAYVTAGQRLTSLQDRRQLRVEFSLAETQLHHLQGAVRLRGRSSRWPGEFFELELESDEGQLDPATRSLRLRARLAQADPRLLPGSLMLVELRNRARQALLVPEAALIPDQRGQRVFVAIKGQAQSRSVQIGRRLTGQVEILSGLEPGERVVVHGGNKLRAGAALQVLAEFDGSVPMAELIRQAGESS